MNIKWSGDSRSFAKETRVLKMRSGQPSEVDNNLLRGSSKLIHLELHEKMLKNSTSTILRSLIMWSKLERWKRSRSGSLMLLFFGPLSHVQLFVTPWTTVQQASLSFTISQSLLRLMSVELVMPFNHLSPPSPAALNLSQHQGLFKWVSSSHQVAKVLEFQLQN